MKALLCIIAALCISTLATANPASYVDEVVDFDDTRLSEDLVYPDWFTMTLGDLREEHKEALKADKKGLIVYFGQSRCAYCEQFLKVNLEAEDIQYYIRKNYDIIPVDIWGVNDIIDTDGISYTERDFSIHYKTNFTPSLVFYNEEGKPVFRLRGYYPPYKFRAALKYVTEDFYKTETFREYLERAEPGVFFMLGGLNERDFFIEPPYNLKEILEKTGNPLIVFFEQGQCHACDVLHTGPLNKEDALKELKTLNSVQLDMWADTPVIKPDGEETTAKNWARELGLFYVPTMVFFDTDGNEIIRLDSVVQFYRLWGVLDYVNKKGYLAEPDYQSWRLKQRETN